MKLIAFALASLLAAAPVLAAPGNAPGNASPQGVASSAKGLGIANSRHSAPLPLAGGVPAALLIGGALMLLWRASRRPDRTD